MSILSPHFPTRAADDYRRSWTRDECHRFYVHQRRQHCSHRELMDLWLRWPCCDQCIQSDPLFHGGPPDVMSGCDWEPRIAWRLGERTLRKIKRSLVRVPDFALHCKRCGGELRPWDGDHIYVQTEHVEEYYGIPMATPGRKIPPDWLREFIIRVYGRRCFGCGVKESECVALGIDHIMPRSKGGDRAFRNLQPLCNPCDQKKANTLPEEVSVFSDIYFGPLPSDGYEGLFW